jgi:chemotaxis protein histidine kinase CheA
VLIALLIVLQELLVMLLLESAHHVLQDSLDLNVLVLAQLDVHHVIKLLESAQLVTQGSGVLLATHAHLDVMEFAMHQLETALLVMLDSSELIAIQLAQLTVKEELVIKPLELAIHALLASSDLVVDHAQLIV